MSNFPNREKTLQSLISGPLDLLIIGGGIGGVTTALALSRKANRPVKLTMTRDEVFRASGPTSSTSMDIRIGAKRDGTITGLECTAIADCGAFYTILTPFISAFTGFVIGGCYKIPNLQFTAKGDVKGAKFYIFKLGAGGKKTLVG